MCPRLLRVDAGGSPVYAMNIYLGKHAGSFEKLLTIICNGCLGNTSAMLRLAIVSYSSVDRLRGTTVSKLEAVVATTTVCVVFAAIVTCCAKRVGWCVTLCLDVR